MVREVRLLALDLRCLMGHSTLGAQYLYLTRTSLHCTRDGTGGGVAHSEHRLGSGIIIVCVTPERLSLNLGTCESPRGIPEPSLKVGHFCDQGTSDWYLVLPYKLTRFTGQGTRLKLSSFKEWNKEKRLGVYYFSIMKHPQKLTSDFEKFFKDVWIK